MYTDNYIKMCEKAEEIQKEWKPKIGDKVKHRLTAVQFISPYDKNTYSDDFYREEGYTYLPTQEQLQEIINAYSNYERVNRFYDFVHLDADEYGYNEWCEFVNNASMNELWLAFVMHEKYHKVWTGEKWKEVVKKMPKQQTLKL